MSDFACAQDDEHDDMVFCGACGYSEPPPDNATLGYYIERVARLEQQVTNLDKRCRHWEDKARSWRAAAGRFSDSILTFLADIAALAEHYESKADENYERAAKEDEWSANYQRAANRYSETAYVLRRLAQWNGDHPIKGLPPKVMITDRRPLEHLWEKRPTRAGRFERLRRAKDKLKGARREN